MSENLIKLEKLLANDLELNEEEKVEELETETEYIREVYIPYIVEYVFKKRRPVSQDDFIIFSQDLYDILKIKEKEMFS